MIELNRTTESLTHFVRLARRGANPAASGGEQRAAKLARTAISDGYGLDDQAKDGYLVFLAVLWSEYNDAVDMIDR